MLDYLSSVIGAPFTRIETLTQLMGAPFHFFRYYTTNKRVLHKIRGHSQVKPRAPFTYNAFIWNNWSSHTFNKGPLFIRVNFDTPLYTNF